MKPIPLKIWIAPYFLNEGAEEQLRQSPLDKTVQFEIVEKPDNAHVALFKYPGNDALKMPDSVFLIYIEGRDVYFNPTEFSVKDWDTASKYLETMFFVIQRHEEIR